MKTKTLFIIALFVAFLCPVSMFAQTYTLNTMTNPDPDANNLLVVWSYDNNNVFAGGYGGALLKYNGSVWTQIITPIPSEEIISIYGSSPTNVWMVTYEGSLLHYNGSTVAKVTTGNLNHLWKIIGFSANDIYFCGEFGTFYHYDGANWSQISNTFSNFMFSEMIGASGNDLYLTGRDLASPYTVRMIHYDGTNLTEVVSGAYGYGWSKAWSPDNNLFYIGGDELYKFNKTSGAVDKILDGMNVVYGFNANEIIVARHDVYYDSLAIYNGSTWKSYYCSYNINSICSPDNNPNNVFLVGTIGGNQGAILHLDLTTGIKENTYAPSTFNIYPNPASGQITIDLAFDKKINTKIELFDLVGKQVKLISEFVGNESRNTVDVSELPAGSYFVKVTTEGNGSFNKKLVITK